MDHKSETESAELVTALVAAFPKYLRKRLEELEIPLTSSLIAGIEAATADLAASLETLASQVPQEQLKSPLELVRDATGPLTKALRDSAAPLPERDDWAGDVHPEDLFDLYPASSRDLGEEAWQLHLAWGIDKARLVAGMVPSQETEATTDTSTTPAVALFGFDANSRARLAGLVGERGYGCHVWRNPAALSSGMGRPPAVAIVDLTHPNAHDAVAKLSGNGIRVIGVQERANDLTMPGILALGADEVLDLAKLVRDLDRVLPQIV